MDHNTFSAVDGYLEGLFVGDDSALAQALDAMAAANLPPINVAPMQGKLLYVLALLVGARRILEIGTLGGYSTIWLARALPPDGELVTLEAEARHAAVARANLEQAGVAARVQLREGDAQTTLAALVAEGVALFDLVFIDADKEHYLAYLDWSLQLVRPGGLLIADNVVRQGIVADPATANAAALAVRRFNAALAAEPRVAATVLQTVGRKGYDGLALAVVRP
jgi:predicted O-methyltransferase YrrM